MPGDFELHFQEGFSGESVVVEVDGLPVSRFTANSRFQTGLAHIERVQITDGSEIKIAIPAAGAKATIKASRLTPYIVINLKDKRLLLEANAESPGYM